MTSSATRAPSSDPGQRPRDAAPGRRLLLAGLAVALGATTLGGAGAAAAAGPRTLHIAPTGKPTGTGTPARPFGTLQQAADVALPGDVLLMHAGRYPGNTQITRSGRPGAPIVVRPAGDGAVSLETTYSPVGCDRQGPAAARTLTLRDGVDHWTFQGLRITQGIWVAGTGANDAAQWIKTRFRAGDYRSRRALPGRGTNDPAAARKVYPALAQALRTAVDPSYGIRLIDNEITGRGIQLNLTSDAVVEGNHIHDIECGTGPAVWINDFSDFATVRRNRISDVAASSYRHFMQEGVRLGSASNYNLVEHNLAEDLPGDGRAFNTDIDASWNVFQRNTARRTHFGFNDQASGWGNQWLFNTAENVRGSAFVFRGVDQDLPRPSLNTSTYRAFVRCNRHLGAGGSSMAVGGIMQSTFVDNYFRSVALSDPARRYWAEEGNRWNGRTAPPPPRPALPPPGACR